jgi:phage major head subunit gpT-like protein
MLSYNPAQLVKGAKAIFMDQLMKEPPSLVGRIATYVGSESRSEDYAWMGEATQMEEAGPELTFTPLTDAQYNLPNKKYWAGLQLKRDDVSDDEVGGFEIRVREMAQVARRFPNKLLTDALVNGTSATLGKCYDGGAFFTATHPSRGRAPAQSNLLTGAGVTTANIQTDIAAGLAALQNIVGENGEPINEGFEKVFIVYPVALEKAMQEAVYAALISNTSNVGNRRFNIDLIPNPRLTDASDWYMGIADSVLMGLIFQDREAIEFSAQDNEASDAEFLREIYRYKTRGRMAAGYARWQRLLKINN